MLECNFRISHEFMKYLKESCKMGSCLQLPKLLNNFGNISLTKAVFRK